ncbi:MAG TPA: 2Fe-2S iron-sulfur cluster-binding protein [Trebonia sp.]|jgi:phenol hydroxylase P5 protein|nr:2Fe-2S iron-sulfur cluster-binding protein [Trebonia sp.]
MTSYTVTVDPLGARVTCRDDQTVLDACLREGIWLPHACTHGTCGTCKAQVTDGEVDLGDASPYALLDGERAAGQALICVAKPRGDVTIEGEIDADDGVDVHPVRDYTGTVRVVADAAAGVRRLIIGLDRPLAFNPGQYVQLSLPSEETRANEETRASEETRANGETRPYSIASPPSAAAGPDPAIELHVRLSPGGAATEGWIFAGLAAGDAVSLSGPYGQFSLRPARPEPVLLLAGGTGLAPMKAILAHLAGTDTTVRSVTLYHGARTVADLYEHDWLRGFAAEHNWFTYRPALSRDSWEGRTGRVPDLLAADYPRASGHAAYICGKPAFVEGTLKALMRARLFPRDIYREDFYTTFDRTAGAAAIRSPLLRR